MNAKSSEPTQVINKRGDLFPVFDTLNIYRATMHFNRQSTVLELNIAQQQALLTVLLTIKLSQKEFKS